MTKLQKIIVGICAVLVFIIIALGAWSGFMYFKYDNLGNRLETALTMKHKNLEVVLSSGYQQITGVTQVADMAKDDLKELFVAAITAREGEDGSKALFKMVTESNPNLDQGLYREIQNVIKATRKEFQTEQTSFLAQKAQYEELLGRLWDGWWLRLVGRPKIDLDAMKIVTTGKASQAIKTGVEEEIKLR